MGFLISSITLSLRGKEIYRLTRAGTEASEHLQELVDQYAENLGCNLPVARVVSREEMQDGLGHEDYGRVIPNVFEGRDVVVFNKVLANWVDSELFDEEEKREMYAVVAHEVAHTTQKPRVSVVQSASFGLPLIVAEGVKSLLNSIILVLGMASLTVVVWWSVIIALFRWAEYDADVKAMERVGADAVRAKYDDDDRSRLPFHTSPSDWERLSRLGLVER